LSVGWSRVDDDQTEAYFGVLPSWWYYDGASVTVWDHVGRVTYVM
jgi:hypothetical protein